MHMIKKGVSLLMALALCLTLLPASALAAEAQGQAGQEQTVLTQGNDGQTQAPGQDGAGEDDKTSDEAPDKAPDKAPDEEPDEAVSAVQALIDALPAAEDISDANADEVSGQLDAIDEKEADVQPTKEMIKLRHKMVYDITNRLESFSLNTVISGFMEYNNKFIEMAKKEGGIDKETLETIAVLLSPFAPHFAEEMWEQLGHGETIFKAGWPSYDESAMKDDEIEVPVQINGKTRAVISISADASKDEAIAAGKEAVADKLTGTIVKEIYVPKKIINIVQK